MAFHSTPAIPSGGREYQPRLVQVGLDKRGPERLTECHTGYRAYSRRFLETVPFLRNGNCFVFDTEVIFQAVHFELPVVEVPVSTRYFSEPSSVGFGTGVVYGLGTLWTAVRFLLHRAGLVESPKFRR